MHVTFVFDDIILSHQPLGASYIAAVLKEAGHTVTAINIDDGPDYVEKIKRLNPGMSAATPMVMVGPSGRLADASEASSQPVRDAAARAQQSTVASIRRGVRI